MREELYDAQESEWVVCPECGSNNTRVRQITDVANPTVWCNDCNHTSDLL
jgi:Zn finger protein HypA/HybF involved in hydrogenase expression